MPFETPLCICGPPRRPRQMLVDQVSSGHASIHDDAVAEKLGFRAGPIEGPTHFSQFAPLCAYLWGQTWFERGEWRWTSTWGRCIPLRCAKNWPT